MCVICREKALEYLTELNNQLLQYGFKSPDMDLYDLEFGKEVVYTDALGCLHIANQYAIHHTCTTRITWENGSVSEFSGLSDHKIFFDTFQSLVGTPIHSVILTKENVIELHVGKNKLEIIPCSQSGEQWRFFMPGSSEKYLVLCDGLLQLE